MKKFYLLGVGGVSMSALAILMKEKGCEVSGCDETSGRGTQVLQEHGIEVDFELSKAKLKDADVVICSSAIKGDHPWKIASRKMKKKILTRGQLLGEISDEYEKVIAVAGSHGKTTTTAMIFQILSVAGLNPTLHLGGFRAEDKLNFCLGGKEYFVTEACEYCNNFLNLHPYISVVTNIEKEHMDFFKTFSNQLKSFEQFKSQSRFVIDNMGKVETRKVHHDENGNLCFSLFDDGKKVMDLKLNICEDVNTQNCIYAYLVAKKLGISNQVIKAGLEEFRGVGLRFERMKCPYFDTVICDYAHHPTEIKKSIETAKKVTKGKKLMIVFQPHTFSRTKTLLHEFLQVFEKEENVVIFKTYSAREKETEGISGKGLGEILNERGAKAKYFDNFESLQKYLLSFDGKKTALLFVGAGDLPSVLHKNNFVE